MAYYFTLNKEINEINPTMLINTLNSFGFKKIKHTDL